MYIDYNTCFLCEWHWLSRLIKAMIEGGLQALCCVLYTPSKVMVVVTYYFWWSHQHDTHLKQYGEEENIHYCRFSLKSYILYAHCWLWFLIGYQPWTIIRSPLFADTDTGIYPQGASQYHARPKVYVFLRCQVWINSRIHGGKQGVTNLSHAQTMLVKVWNISADLKL